MFIIVLGFIYTIVINNNIYAYPLSYVPVKVLKLGILIVL